MKFDFCIGNPPYQGENHMQLYPDFYLAGMQIADCVDMIFPTGWQDPKTANNLGKLNNQEIKSDKQIVCIDNRQNVFPGVVGAEWTNIIIWKKGYDNGLDGKQLICTNGSDPEERRLAWDKNDIYSLVSSHVLLDINNKVSSISNESIMSIIGLQTKFNLDKLYEERPDLVNVIGSDGKDKRVRKDAFSKIPFFTENPVDKSSVKIYGLLDRQRTERYISSRFLDLTEKSFNKYRVLLPGVAGVGFGCKLSSSIIISPKQGFTETFISFGGFDSFQTAVNCDKYLKTKFARVLLSILKMTRQNNRSVWKYVPLQDFESSSSDVDWTKSVTEIDRQLYRKYNLSDEEIAFIESHVKEME